MYMTVEWHVLELTVYIVGYWYMETVRVLHI